MGAANPQNNDSSVVAAAEAAPPSGAATQVAPDGSPAPAPDDAPGSGPPPEEELNTPDLGASDDSADAVAGDGARTADDGDGNHRDAGELDLEELVARAEKAEDYLELAQRTKADFENYRKRAVREAAAAQMRGVTKLARELLPAIDNLDRALAAADASAAGELASGIKLVHDEVLAALGRVGIEPFSPVGEPFDPQHHEAVAQQPAEGAEPGTIVEVYQRGYRLGDAVIRPARVSVAG